jgi:hypothetical protein
MEVTLEEAYAEACRALGEAIVRERLLARTLQQQEEPKASGEVIDHNIK